MLREHRLHHGQAHPRLVTDARHRAAAGVKVWVVLLCVRERMICAVVVANPLAKVAIAPRATEGLDPLMLIGRDRLAGELAADPVGLFGEDDGAAKRCSAQGGGDAAGAAADD